MVVQMGWAVHHDQMMVGLPQTVTIEEKMAMGITWEGIGEAGSVRRTVLSIPPREKG
jgi:hypothetical protein